MKVAKYCRWCGDAFTKKKAWKRHKKYETYMAISEICNMFRR